VRINKQIIVGSVIVISLVVAIVLPVYFTLKLIREDPIIIWGDEEFSNYDFKGNGTASNPYLIENYNITTDSYYGIFIKGVTKHFIIRNCFIDALKIGIYIENTADGTSIIADNICYNNIDFGIQVIDSDYLVISNNTCISDNNLVTNQGISISFSSNSFIYNNTCFLQKTRGISILNSPYTKVVSNNCSNNSDFGLFVDDSSYSTISNNFFLNNGLNGLSITLSPNTLISGNSFIESGLLFWEYYIEDIVSYTVENNQANNKPIGFYKNLDNQLINTTNDGQSFFINCTNLVIENLTIDNSLGVTLSFCNNATIKKSSFSNIPRPGLLFWYCNNSIIIDSSCMYNKADGLAIAYSNNISAENNRFEFNFKNGIRVLQSTNSYLFNNTCRFNTRLGDRQGDRDGILIQSSNNSTMINNTCTHNGDDGISLYLSEFNAVINNTLFANTEGLNMHLAHNSAILNNTFGPQLYGIYQRLSDNITISGNFFANLYGGIYIFGSSYCEISHNSIVNSDGNGIVYGTTTEASSINNTIHHNLFDYNEYGGIRLTIDCINTLIHHNAFYNNYFASSSQAYDSSINATWYDLVTTSGNFWNDWSGVGYYYIGGPAESYDIYPLSSDPLS